MAEPLRLGFGASALGGDLNRRQQHALVETALDCGFRHFDVAPSYGNGHAEVVLGAVLSVHREHVTVTTKAGIAHPQHARATGLLRASLRPLKQLAPGVWRRAAEHTRKATARRGRFAGTELEATLHESLRRLGIAQVHRLLLHEAELSDVDERLVATLQRLREKGLVGGIGLGTSVEQTLALQNRWPDLFATLQVNHYWGAFTADLRGSGRELWTHRSLRDGLQRLADPTLQAAVAAHPQASSLRRLLQDPGAVHELLLAAALQALPTGLLLVSSSDPTRLRELARWARRATPTPEAEVLNECLRAVAVPGCTADTNARH